MRIRNLIPALFFTGLISNASAQLADPAVMNDQLADSTKSYVWDCVNLMQKQSLYSSRVNWEEARDSVARMLNSSSTLSEAENIVIWVFKKLEDHHGMYGGIDTSYRYPAPGAARKMSASILAEYKKPRAVKIQMLSDNIAYYKMPAVLVGSNTEKMKEWANLMMDSLCSIASNHPRGFIIDLRMNNGGNSEPMWQTLRHLIGEKNRVRLAGADGKLLKDEMDAAMIQYRQAGMPDRLCTLNEKLPVAVLIGAGTASSGEIMALSFSTRKNTRLFGEPTYGVANATNGFVVQNKGYLLLTVSYLSDGKKKLLKQMAIQPDVLVQNDGDNFADPARDTAVIEAMGWLRKKM
ncbi:S41 family peptidase [Terrimonas sp. NA20]|uniref:S41 family peptidase n=1 Tax=Terrimonas ginsenosidimutans TaxID=2908004 RepID=A0ABS9KXC9_9BACT|nr:S41 family peptidase [Terrimonas ginsenosidimutans]MCG2616884.1 S41 family peptidase [Terrimonas ginsenosidimutans]